MEHRRIHHCSTDTAVMIFHVDGTKPTDNRIFVFGSNRGGKHGAGAALEARLRFGALLGHGEGLVGNSYAIPTKTANFECLSLEEIEQYVETFVLFTLENPDMQFFVTRVGCGLAGNKDSDIAPMFRGAINCSFPENWRSYLT
jgi:hypothetical protein